ncbi:endopeptidase La [Mycoplasmopsis agassizii]|uniref:endopeptidase La n=1 Tax=Mycoplasmopsis agassizii TaxID=33922 RepID=UPI003526F8D9
MIKPVIATRGLLLLQFVELEFQVGRPASISALRLAQNNYNNEIVLASQIQSDSDVVETVSDLHKVGFLSKIISSKEEEGIFKVTVLPFKRVSIVNLFVDESNAKHKTMAEIQDFNINVSDVSKAKAILKSLINWTEDKDVKIDPNLRLKFSKLQKRFKDKKAIDFENIDVWFQPLENSNDLEDYTSFLNPILVSSYFVDVLKPDDDWVKKYNSYLDWVEQADRLILLVTSKVHESEVENDIEKRLKNTLNKQQREFLLREKLKAIRNELGEENSDEDSIFEEYSEDKEENEDKEPNVENDDKNVKKNRYPRSIIKLIANEKSKLKGMMSSSPDANISRNYIDLLKELPWRKVLVDDLDIAKTKEILDRGHYGLKEVKERVLEYIAILINNNKKHDKSKKFLKIDDTHNVDLELFEENEDDYERKSFNNVPILTLVGPPGTGKTSLAKSVAEALGKKFVKISLGGIKDESEIRGHRRTYVGALPGKIIAAIKRAKVSNPIILLDEIDKMTSQAQANRGDASAAMLEVLDPEQNHKFQDHYLEHEYDLSKVIFIATANYYEDIPAPLLDRVEIINLSSYTILEKVQIARNYLIDKVRADASLEERHFKISDDVLKYIINHYTLEAGVRNLRRILDKVARKIVVKLLNSEIKDEDEFEITEDVAFELLGVHRFSNEVNDKEPQIGSINGLAYTSYGGSTLKIEVNLYPGKGKISLTGRLKDVMQESAQTALSYVRSNAEKFNIPKDFSWESYDIHIHVPAGAIPKDGPSAGVTFTTAIISAVTRRAVSQTVGMTGEITLRGKVLAIGGLKEKSIAAHKFGVKTVFIPHDNEKDLIEVPDEVKNELTYIPVKEYDEIFNHLFAGVTSNPLETLRPKEQSKQ